MRGLIEREERWMLFQEKGGHSTYPSRPKRKSAGMLGRSLVPSVIMSRYWLSLSEASSAISTACPPASSTTRAFRTKEHPLQERKTHYRNLQKDTLHCFLCRLLSKATYKKVHIKVISTKYRTGQISYCKFTKKQLHRYEYYFLCTWQIGQVSKN